MDPSRELAAALEPVTGQVYFSPECHHAYEALGFGASPIELNGVAMPDGPAYFCSRGSVMGQVPGELIAAAFAVFNPEVVVPAVHIGWAKTDATTICAARTDGAVGQLKRILGDAPDGLARATELLARATASLRPRTGLKDMYVQIFPGKDGPPVKQGFTIPARNSLTDVDLDEILSQLDTRTRDYVTLLANGAGQGLRGRGRDLANVLKRFEPTVRDLGRVNHAVGAERVQLRRLVTSLAQVNNKLAQKPQDVTKLVDTAATTSSVMSAASTP